MRERTRTVAAAGTLLRRLLLPSLLPLLLILGGCSERQATRAPEPAGNSRAAAGAQRASPRIIVLISLDTVRADALGIYGYPRPTSPVLDLFAAQGVVFDDASAAAPWTLPSHASILTGLFPLRHGVTTAQKRLSPAIPTLAGLLRANGWETAAVVSATWLKKKPFGLTRDFDRYLYIPEVADRRKPSTWVTDQALTWIDQARDRRLFLFVHYYDVHSDYASLPAYEKLFVRPYKGIADGTTWQLTRASLPEAHVKMCRRKFDPAKCSFGNAGGEPKVLDGSVEPIHFDQRDARHLKDLYDASIRQLDTELGRFFAGLRERGLMDKALLVVTADHGEQFLEHGGVEHFLWTWQEILHVPLLIHGPGVPAGVRVDAPVSSVDIVPTLLGFAGVPLPRSGLDGRDLRPLWGKDGASAAGPFRERFLYGEASGGLSYASTMPGVYPIYRSVRRGRYKLIEEIPPSGGERKSLYDLESDPDERVDVSTAHPETEAALAAEMKRRYAGAATAKGNAVELKREDRERLRALGYLP